jgi:septal ring factor EnvC (AmiA/AmiB activator)
MKRLLGVLAASVLLMAMAARAGDDADLTAARSALETARQHLRSASRDYEGHRKRAVELVTSALGQVDEALKVARRRERQDQKKVDQLERKIDRLEKRQEKIQQE